MAQYNQGYIYTYSDLDKASQDEINLLDLSGRREKIGEQIINKGFLNKPLKQIDTVGKEILKISIIKQEKREQAVYKALGVSGDDVKTLSDNLRKALFGELADEVDYKDGQGPTKRMDKIFTFLRDYLHDALYEDVKNIAEGIKNGTAEDKDVITVYNRLSDPAQHLTVGLAAAQKRDGFLITDIEELKKIYEKEQKSKQEILSLYNNLQQDPITANAVTDILQVAKQQNKSASASSSLGQNASLNMRTIKKLVAKYARIAKMSVTGDVGEKAVSYFVEYGQVNIIEGVQKAFTLNVIPTSKWANNNKGYLDSAAESLTNYLNNHYNGHPLLKDFVVAKNKKMVSSLLPKEDIAIEITLNGGKIASSLLPNITGISIKTSFYEGTNEDFNGLTIQSSSFRSFLQNLFYAPSGSLGYAATFYQALLKIAMNLAGEVGWGEFVSGGTAYTFHSIMSDAINYFAYVWLTGVISNEKKPNHSDFFFVYKDRKTYLIPMSALLKEVENKMSNSDPLIKEGNLLWQKYSIPDEQLAALDNAKKGNGVGKGDELLKMQEYVLGPHGISRPGQIKLSNFPNLVQGMGL